MRKYWLSFESFLTRCPRKLLTWRKRQETFRLFFFSFPPTFSLDRGGPGGNELGNISSIRILRVIGSSGALQAFESGSKMDLVAFYIIFPFKNKRKEKKKMENRTSRGQLETYFVCENPRATVKDSVSLKGHL